MLLSPSRSVRRIYLIFSFPFEDIYTHIKRTTASVMTTLLYGKRCFQWSGSDAEIFFEGAKLLNNVTDPGAHPPIDLFWPLKYVPYVERWGWAKWKPLCDTTKSVRDALYIRLLEECEERLKSGRAVGCYIETILNNQADLGMTRDEIRYVSSLDFSFRNQELTHMTKFSVD
jgi:hypothetical protein